MICINGSLLHYQQNKTKCPCGTNVSRVCQAELLAGRWWKGIKYQSSGPFIIACVCRHDSGEVKMASWETHITLSLAIAARQVLSVVLTWSAHSLIQRCWDQQHHPCSYLFLAVDVACSPFCWDRSLNFAKCSTSWKKLIPDHFFTFCHITASDFNDKIQLLEFYVVSL